MLLFAAVEAEGQADTLWVDARELTVEGQGWSATERPYDRLPLQAKGVVPDGVWGLQKQSAGIAVRFRSDAQWIACRWKLGSEKLAMDHMPATGVSGVDLYMRMPAELRKPSGQIWHWIGVGRPTQQEMESKIAGGIPQGEHEFTLYLPLYNSTAALEVGVPVDASIVAAAPRGKPFVVWGTSITQGGCASRPGMAYPAIMGRWLDRPHINLGFSGNGQMQPEVTRFLAQLDASVFVIDCLPNLSPELVTQRTAPVVLALRQAHPETPIVLVENIEYQASAALPGPRHSYQSKNAALRAVYEQLIADGVTGLTYVEGEPLFGNDGEATVDGTHATDVGFLRMAEGLTPVLRDLLTD
jgi:hypothetical protein